MKTSETALRRFRTAMDTTADAIFLVNRATMRFVEVNATACSMLGYTRAELLQMGPAQTHVATIEQMEKVYDALIAGQECSAFPDLQLVRKDGSRLMVDARRDAICSGADWIIVSVLRDITERKQSEDALRTSEHAQRQLADQLEIERARLVAAQRIAKIGSWETDLVTLATIWSEETHRIFETDPATYSVTHQNFLEFVHPEDRARVADAFEKSLAGQTACAIQHRLLLPDGHIKYVEERWQVAFDEQETAVRVLGTCQDITERKSADELVRRSSHDGTRKQKQRVSIELAILAVATLTIYELSAYFHWFESVTHWVLTTDSGDWDEDVVAASFFLAGLLVFAFRRLRESQSSLIGHHQVQGALRLLHEDLDRQVEQRTEELGSANRALNAEIIKRKEQERKITRLNRIRAVIGGVSSAMLRLHDRDELLEEACRVAETEGVFPMAWIDTKDSQTGRVGIKTWHGEDPRAVDLIMKLNGRETWSEADRPSYRAVHSARPHVVNDLSTDPTMAPIREDLLRHGYRAVAAFPLSVETKVVAVLVLLASECNFFDAEEIALLEWLTADLSFALEHIEKSQRLDYLASYDTLTGIPNARLFNDRLQQLVHAARRDQCRVCVVVVDLERFTEINDTLGRNVGDELLRQVAERFEQFLVEPFALGRIGADTFAAASPRDSDSIATKLRDRMLDALKEPFNIDGRAVRIGIQAGIALFPADGNDGKEVFKNAEAALKLAKSSGEPYAYHSSEMNSQIALRLAQADQLRAAVVARQFVLHYQPRVDMTSGEVVGAEALIRWQHPDRGLVNPGDFIALAEETGLIVPIGSWVIDTVCAQQAAWIVEGLNTVPIAVNLSSVQFETGDLLQIVRDALAAHSLDPRLLELELTESAVMNDSATAATTLQALRKLGVRLALDDFGTGYSSLAHLRRFPFNSVKIDRSFITDIICNADDAAIANAIIAMAHRLNLKVVAEGVETQGQFNYLRAQACDEMQGFFFSPAIAREAFESNLRSGKHMTLSAPSSADQLTLLLVDDEPGICAALVRMLRRDGYRILTAASGQEGLEVLALNSVQVIISDQRMPGMSGTEFLNTVKQLYPDTVRIILSGYTDLNVVTESVNRGAVFKFLTKPWDDDLLREQVRDAFRRYSPNRVTRSELAPKSTEGSVAATTPSVAGKAIASHLPSADRKHLVVAPT